MNLTSQGYVTRLIERLINQTDLNQISTPDLERLYTAIKDVYDTEHQVLTSIPTCSSYHKKMEELLGTRRCKELDYDRRVLNGTEEPY